MKGTIETCLGAFVFLQYKSMPKLHLFRRFCRLLLSILSFLRRAVLWPCPRKVRRWFTRDDDHIGDLPFTVRVYRLSIINA